MKGSVGSCIFQFVQLLAERCARIRWPLGFYKIARQDRLATEKVESRCAVYIIDTKTGDIAHWLRIEGVVTELYDVIALPGIKRPSMIGFRSQEVRRMVSIEA